MTALNHFIAAECRARNIEVDVSEIEALSSWQKQRIQGYLKHGQRTIPRVLYPQCETPDFRTPWIEDLVHDVEDCLRHSGVELSVSLASKIRQRNPIIVDELVIGFWSEVAKGREPSQLDIESIPLRNEDDSTSNPIDTLALTEVAIPPEVGDAVKIFEQIELLNANIDRFLNAIAAISLMPDLRPISEVIHNEELIAALRKCGVFRVCDLVASVVTGSVHQFKGLSKKSVESVIEKAAEIQRQCFDSIRKATVKKS